MLHSYVRCLGRITVVFYITIFGSLVRLLAIFLLIPQMHIDSVFIGQIINWGADAIVSVIPYTALYRKQNQIERILSRNHAYLKNLQKERKKPKRSTEQY